MGEDPSRARRILNALQFLQAPVDENMEETRSVDPLQSCQERGGHQVRGSITWSSWSLGAPHLLWARQGLNRGTGAMLGRVLGAKPSHARLVKVELGKLFLEKRFKYRLRNLKLRLSCFSNFFPRKLW